MGAFQDSDDDSWPSSSEEDDASSSSLSRNSFDSDSNSTDSSDDSSWERRREGRQHPVKGHHEGLGSSLLPSLVRHRRNASETKRLEDPEPLRRKQYRGYQSSSSDDSSSSKARKRRKRRVKGRSPMSSFHWSTSLLAVSLLIWCGVQIITTDYVERIALGSMSIENGDPRLQSKYKHGIDGGRNSKYHHGNRASIHGKPHRRHPAKRTTAAEKERLKPGCELDSEWQTPDSNARLLSCQVLHELDLSRMLSVEAPEGSKRSRALSFDTHLGSGLWRDVWKLKNDAVSAGLDGTANSNFVVLKTMKPEHDINLRNLERHRREAATLSRLTSSPYVTDLYAYCGNSILTEYASQDLSNALRRNERSSASERPKRKSHRLRKIVNETTEDTSEFFKTASRSEGANITSTQHESLLGGESLISQLPLETRLEWAVQVASGVADVHRTNVIHADITTKQFLVVMDSTTMGKEGKGVRVKLNDFNRCRFVPKRKESERNGKERFRVATSGNETMCTVRIPSAPGHYRSPEEYSDQPLTTQIDVFSLGHVLFELWKGFSPWEDIGGKQLKSMVMSGKLPTALQLGLQDQGVKTKERAYHLAFGNIIRDCYWVDTHRRLTAEGLVEELTKLLEAVRLKKEI